jgi:hypothetical protein
MSLKENSASTMEKQKSWCARANRKNDHELTNGVTYVFLVLYEL